MSVRVDVSIVLWHTDMATFEWACRGIAEQGACVRRTWLLANEDPAGTVRHEAAEVARRIGLDVVAVSREDNTGFAGGHNLLLERSFADGADAVLVLNPDAHLLPGCVATLVAAGARHPGALLGPLLVLADTDGSSQGIDSAGIVWTRTGRHFDALQGAPVDAAPDGDRRVAGLTGACLYVPKDVHARLVSATGEFFDADFLAYREDAELGLRASVIGVDQWMVPESRALHVRSVRGSQRGRSEFIDRLGVRNRFLIAFKHGSGRPGTPILVVARDLLVVAAVLLRERTSVPGLKEAWRLRHRMRAKRARMLDAARTSSP